MPHKRWSLDSYAELGQRLVHELKVRLLLSWGPGEKPMTEEIVAAMDHPAELIPDTPSMKSLGCLLSRSDLVIGGDTGPVHLASVLGVPTITILGPTDSRLYHPYGYPERGVHAPLPCSPCRQRDCVSRTCLEMVTPNDVFEQARRALVGPE